MSADLWCLGILAYEFIIGAPPFETPGGYQQTYKRIAKVDLHWPEEYPVSEEARDLIEKVDTT